MQALPKQPSSESVAFNTVEYSDQTEGPVQGVYVPLTYEEPPKPTFKCSQCAESRELSCALKAYAYLVLVIPCVYVLHLEEDRPRCILATCVFSIASKQAFRFFTATGHHCKRCLPGRAASMTLP